MTFGLKFNKLLSEDINDLRTLYKKGGYDKRHMNAKTGSKRLHQNLIPAIHRADPSKNNKIEHLRNGENGAPSVLPRRILVSAPNSFSSTMNALPTRFSRALYCR